MRLNADENQILHNAMIKLAILMNKYRVMPKVFFKDAVYNIKNRIELR
jgi:hypothetical protein